MPGDIGQPSPAGIGGPGFGVTDDGFLDQRLRIFQPATGYRAGLDAVLLGAAAAAEAPDIALDAGAGVGVAGLVCATLAPAASLTLLEIEPGFAALARRNAARNPVADRVRVQEGDLFDAALPLAPAYDVILTNPPYSSENEGTVSPDLLRRASFVMTHPLGNWLLKLRSLLAPGGRLVLVHRYMARQAIIAALARHGAVDILPLAAADARAPKRLLARFTEGAAGAPVVHPPLLLHAPGGAFTGPVEDVLRGRALLPVAPPRV